MRTKLTLKAVIGAMGISIEMAVINWKHVFVNYFKKLSG